MPSIYEVKKEWVGDDPVSFVIEGDDEDFLFEMMEEYTDENTDFWAYSEESSLDLDEM